MSGRLNLRSSKRVVIKVGTSTLTYQSGKLNLRKMERLAWVLSSLRNEGRQIILVSSGAIGVGAERLGMLSRPRDTQGKQAAAAVGQAVLMQIYQNFFMEYNQKVAQILLTKDVTEHMLRKRNAINTFNALFDMGVIPIVNENDSISTEELEFSDNDQLSAHVACLVDADALMLITDINGLYDKNPNEFVDARIIHNVNIITDSIIGMADSSGSKLGTGGMASKIMAAQMATEHSIATLIMSGENPLDIFSALEGETVGTFFEPASAV